MRLRLMISEWVEQSRQRGWVVRILSSFLLLVFVAGAQSLLTNQPGTAIPLQTWTHVSTTGWGIQPVGYEKIQYIPSMGCIAAPFNYHENHNEWQSALGCYSV